MQMTRLARGLGIVAAVTVAGCKSLDVQNPNSPDARRALADPSALEAVAGGTLRTWMTAYVTDPTTVLCTQANSCTASWNNDNMNFYSSLDPDNTRGTRSWQNDPSAAARTSIENYWFGYYSALSSSNDVLKAIRQNGVVIVDAGTTKRSETIAQLMQAASLAEIALNYDKGYIVFDSTDLSTLDYSDRKKMRDAAMAKFDAAIALANANSFSTPGAWTNGQSYTNTQVARIANTMAARLLAYWPRNAAENAQVDWARVISYASKGISTGGAFDFLFTGDGSNFYPEVYTWFDDMTSGRVHTRIAKMLDPVTQKDPFDSVGGGSPQPHSPDKRLGDGTFGNASMIEGYGNIPKDAGAGTDFAWSSQNVMRPSRGQYHQSNIAFVRWDCDGLDDANSIGFGYCPYPVLMAAQNDLLWAEGLIRTSGDLALAATLINNSRVKRGGLSPATAADGAAGLQTKLYYEQEVELFALSATSFYNNRRLDKLVTGTPAEMPVPAKELGVFGQALYTWGGASPRSSPTPP
jgi:hypothetical protein